MLVLNRLLRYSIFLVGTSLLAQDIQTVLFGQKWLNGHAWVLLMGSNEKTLYLTALGEGAGIAIINWFTTGKPKPSAGEFQRQESYYESDAAFTADDTAAQIDKFYVAKANREIPVAYAYLFVMVKFRGGSAQELEG